VIYDALCVEMAAGSSNPFPMGASPEDWQEYTKRAAAIEQIRFRRNERTEKTLGELRRILGSELAASVPGLVIDPEAEADANDNPYGFSNEMSTQDDD
jgi:hypothetical protein